MQNIHNLSATYGIIFCVFFILQYAQYAKYALCTIIWHIILHFMHIIQFTVASYFAYFAYFSSCNMHNMHNMHCALFFCIFNSCQKPIENVAQFENRTHRFGSGYQRAVSERLKHSKSNNFKSSNFLKSVDNQIFVLSADALQQESGRNRIKTLVTILDFMDFFAMSGL